MCEYKVDENGMIRIDIIEFNVMPKTSNGRGNTNTNDGTEGSTRQAESQSDSSFSADDHQAHHKLNKQKVEGKHNLNEQ